MSIDPLATLETAMREEAKQLSAPESLRACVLDIPARASQPTYRSQWSLLAASLFFGAVLFALALQNEGFAFDENSLDPVGLFLLADLP